MQSQESVKEGEPLAASPRYDHALLEYLREKGKEISPLLIIIHDYPDPDAIAGGVALEYLCEKGFGISCRVVYGGTIGRQENRAMIRELNLKIHKIELGEFAKHKHAACVDTQPSFENNRFVTTRRARIVIDQHQSVAMPLADLVLIDPDCGASCVIVAKAMLELGLEIPQGIGTALVYGILTDTLNFARNSASDVIKTYLALLPSCDMQALSRIQNPQRSKSFFTTLGRGIRRTVSHRGLLVSHLGEVSHPDLVSMVADFLLSYKQAKRSFCTGRYKGRLHMSFRLAKATTSAGAILRDIVSDPKNAGGHGRIGGGSIRVGSRADEATWQTAETELTQKLLRRLRLPTTKEPYYPFRRNTE